VEIRKVMRKRVLEDARLEELLIEEQEEQEEEEVKEAEARKATTSAEDLEGALVVEAGVVEVVDVVEEVTEENLMPGFH